MYEHASTMVMASVKRAVAMAADFMIACLWLAGVWFGSVGLA